MILSNESDRSLNEAKQLKNKAYRCEPGCLQTGTKQTLSYPGITA